MKRKRTSIFLCVFFGPFGIHKFYEGNIAMGIVYLCTAGLGFVGWVADIIKYITMKEEYYDPQKMKEEKRVQKEERNTLREEKAKKKQELLRKRKCPRCGGANYHTFVTEKEIVPEKRIMRNGLNLNPLHPLTFSKTKEKIVQKRITKNVSQFVCNDCGKIFK